MKRKLSNKCLDSDDNTEFGKSEISAIDPNHLRIKREELHKKFVIDEPYKLASDPTTALI